jgi:hypothetical protein
MDKKTGRLEKIVCVQLLWLINAFFHSNGIQYCRGVRLSLWVQVGL